MPFPPQTILPENTSFRLLCYSSSGTKPLYFQWHKNGHLLSSNEHSNYKIETSNDNPQSILIIQKVVGNDAGNYSCICTNAFGNDIQYSSLIVKG
jgi:hypothetical protein